MRLSSPVTVRERTLHTLLCSLTAFNISSSLVVELSDMMISEAAVPTGVKLSAKSPAVTARLVIMAIKYRSAPQIIPTLMAQNKNTRSVGSFIAVRKRTMERALVYSNT